MNDIFFKSYYWEIRTMGGEDLLCGDGTPCTYKEATLSLFFKEPLDKIVSRPRDLTLIKEYNKCSQSKQNSLLNQ